MEKRPEVSVIVPVYQVESYLERAVESLLAQTLEELEIILVDDGSTDQSPQICDEYARRFPEKVRVLHQENRGLGLARNAGLDLARGEYVAFVDSDDTVEPDMYRAMAEKARAGDYDMVFCDVRILYVDEGRESVSQTYPEENIDLGDYLVRGNNITYSVNKLYRRTLWEGLRYEKMLFEDIALIPALVTRTASIGYVREPFYNYCRRSGTLSTSQVGAMGDVVTAFRLFLTRCGERYREEAVYCAAKQLCWNMTQSRTVFLPDFIGLLRDFRKDFALNPYLAKDPQARKILDYLDRPVIPRRLVCAHCGRPLPAEWRQAVERDFPQGEVVELTEADLPEDLPPAVARAIEVGRWDFVEEYLALGEVYEKGGIALAPECRTQLGLNRLRLDRVFFGFEDGEALTAGCFGAVAGHYVLEALLDTYREENLYNAALLPLKERLRDFLLLRMGLQANGKKQLLQGEVQVYPPDVLAFDMRNGENCCKYQPCPAPEGFEVVRASLLERWSKERMENWNLYKRERDRKGGGAPPAAAPAGAVTQGQLEEELRRLAETYESSTSWKVTRPLRAVAKLWKR